jgi:hypothetical protein
MKIKKIYPSMLDTLFKPFCKGCKFLKKSSSGDTCKKFLVTPNYNIYSEKMILGNIDYREKHPYTITARLDVTMCGLYGRYYTNRKE